MRVLGVAARACESFGAPRDSFRCPCYREKTLSNRHRCRIRRALRRLPIRGPCRHEPPPATPRPSTRRCCSAVLCEVKAGDFTARMPVHWTGMGGKIADRLNEIIGANEALGTELERVSRVVGKEGKLSQRVSFKGTDQVWGSHIEAVNSLIEDLVRPSNEMQRVIGAVAGGDLSKKVSADVQGEMLELKNTINGMVDQLNGFISEVTRVAREVGTEGRLGQAAAVTIEVGGVWKELTDNVNLMAGNLTGQVRDIAGGDDRGRQRRPQQEDHRRRARGVPRAQEHRQRDGRPAQPLRRRGHARGPRGRRRGQARRAGADGGGRGRLEGPDRRRQPARGEPDQPGARDRRGGDGGDRGRPDPPGQRRGERRARDPQGQAQRDDPQPARDHAAEHGAGLAEDQPRALHPQAPGPARPGDRLAHDPVRADAARLRAARRLLRADRRRRTAASRSCSSRPATATRSASTSRTRSGSARAWSASARSRRSGSSSPTSRPTTSRSAPASASPRR